MVLFPARPFAITLTMSFVEVSPSTLIILKLSATSAERAFCNIAGVIEISLVIKISIVAILGFIMPEPFPMPPIWHSVPPISKEKAISFSLVSVVIIPLAASALFFPRAFTSAGMPFLIGVMSRF